MISTKEKEEKKEKSQHGKLHLIINQNNKEEQAKKNEQKDEKAKNSNKETKSKEEHNKWIDPKRNHDLFEFLFSCLDNYKINASNVVKKSCPSTTLIISI